MDGDEELTSLQGVKFRESIVTEVCRATPIRHFGIRPTENSDTPLGPLSLFSFLAPLRTDLPSKSVTAASRHHLLEALGPHSHTGVYLDSTERGALFPLIHLTDDRDSLNKRLSGEHVINNDYKIYQGVYREVRSIRPEGVFQNGHNLSDLQTTAYILLGFKSTDKSFSQEVMVESWKDWTGARYIYMNLPDDLGLRRISFYQREAPDSMNMFLYLVLVECTLVSTMEHQIRLQDFTQRLRAEKMTGYISVYGVQHVD